MSYSIEQVAFIWLPAIVKYLSLIVYKSYKLFLSNALTEIKGFILYTSQIMNKKCGYL